jgi:hypothetical protein
MEGLAGVGRFQRVAMSETETNGEAELPTLDEILLDLREEYASPGAARALDLVTEELARTHGNLKGALRNLEPRPLELGGRKVLEDLDFRAWIAGAA